MSLRRAAAGCLLLLPCWAAASDTASQVFAAASPSVYSIGVLSLDGEARTGSGVGVAPGRVATNFHVVSLAREIRIKHGEITGKAVIETADEKHDLALLRVEGLDPVPTTFGTGAVGIGQSVYAIGSPRGLELSLSEGIVSSLRKTEDGELIQTTAPISPGSSGGGLFDAEGRLVGLTTAQVVNGQNLNFAIPVEWLRFIGVAVEPTAATAAAAETATVIAVPPLADETAPEPAPEAAVATQTRNVPEELPPPKTAEKSSGNIYIGFAMIGILLLGTKPAINWLTEFMSRDAGPSAEARATAARAAKPDRLRPFRTQAREEIKAQNKDADVWLHALEQSGGDELRATAAYIELRAQALYRADLDKKWAAAQAQGEQNRFSPATQAKMPGKTDLG